MIPVEMKMLNHLTDHVLNQLSIRQATFTRNILRFEAENSISGVLKLHVGSEIESVVRRSNVDNVILYPVTTIITSLGESTDDINDHAPRDIVDASVAVDLDAIITREVENGKR